MFRSLSLLQSVRRSALPIAAFLLVGAGSVRAASINGQANIAGTVTVTANTITFAPAIISTGPGASETGDFSGLTGGTIASLPAGTRTGDYSQPGMIHFTEGLAAPVTFDLTYIAPGVGTVSGCSSGNLGSICTPLGSPFTLIQLTNSSVVATLQFNGVSYSDTADSGTSPTVGVFSTTSVIAGSVPQIYQTLATGGSLDNISFSASFNAVSPTPEPATTACLALGLVGVGLLASHKLRRQS